MIRNKLLILILCLITFNSVAEERPETTRIIISNPEEILISAGPELTPDFRFDGFRTQKANDTLLLESNSPFRLVFYAFNEYKVPFYITFLVDKGEEFRIEWESESIRAISDDKIRENELNFFIKMQKDLGSFEGLFNVIPHKRKNADSLLYKVQELYQSRLDFLEDYRQNFPMSTKYIEQLKKVLLYRQYYEFLDNSNIDRILDKILLDNTEIRKFLEFAWNGEEENIYSLETLYLLELMIYEEEDYTMYYKNLQEKYKGKQLDFLRYKVLTLAYRSEELGFLAENYLSSAQSDILKEFIAEKYGDFIGGGLEIISPEYDYKQESILYHLKTGEYISWDTFLKTGKPLYIDFWATWCGGCRVNLPYTRQLAKEYAVKDIRVVYVSMDKNTKAWAKISEKEQIPAEDSYLLLDPTRTFILKKYNISPIPRYMFVDNQGQIINEKAPAPNSYNIRNELDKMIKK